MLKYSSILAAVLATATLSAAADQTSKQPAALYIPIAVYYTNGQLDNVVAYPQTRFDSLKKCVEDMQHAISDMKQSGKVPTGGDVLGTCLPVPITPPHFVAGQSVPPHIVPPHIVPPDIGPPDTEQSPSAPQPPVKGIGRDQVSNL